MGSSARKLEWGGAGKCPPPQLLMLNGMALKGQIMKLVDKPHKNNFLQGGRKICLPPPPSKSHATPMFGPNKYSIKKYLIVES